MSILHGRKDIYHGITIDLAKQKLDSIEAFSEAITHTISVLKQEGIRGVWLRIPKEQSEFIPEAVKLRFIFHHAEPSYLMMTYWIPDPTIDPNKLPLHCQHFIGAGGAVVDIQNEEILLVTEKTRRHVDEQLVPWKIPGGTLDDPNEEIGSCAEREVFEETGVKCEFVAILGFRHMHGYRFGKSDIYFICLMKPITKEIIKDDHEIDKCQWVPLSEYFAMNSLGNVQMAAKEAIQRYLKDPSKHLTHSDVSLYNPKYGKGTMYACL
jgi:8-oxo-dGTP pyrophosphatase MutT (NUDIX family)